MSSEVQRVRSDIQGGDWHVDIQAAPACVLVLAECKLLITRLDAMRLELKGPGLQYTVLLLFDR